MKSARLTIVNKLGLHARASALFVKTASRFSSEVRLSRDDVEVNGKSIMGIMMLAAGKGTTLTLTVEGCDEEDAFRELSELVTNGFGEE